MPNKVKIHAKLWESLRSGRDIELYVLVGLATLLILFDLLGNVPASLVSSATLAVLALLGVALVRVGAQIRGLQELATTLPKGSLAAQFFLPDDDLSEIREFVRTSRSVWLWGGTLAAHLPALVETMEESVARGLHLKILLMLPRSASIEMAVFQAGKGDVEELNAHLMRNLNRLARIHSRGLSGSIEVRGINYLAPYALYAYNPELPSGELDSSGVLEMRLTTFRGSMSMRPTFRLEKARDGEWYAYFIHEFQKAWDAADILLETDGRLTL